MHFPDAYYVFAVKEFLSITTAGSIAETFGFPINTVKVRLQLQGEHLQDGTIMKRYVYYKGTIDAMKKIAIHEGYGSLFKGVSAIYQRQVIFNGVRTIIHYPVRRTYLEILQFFSKTWTFNDAAVRVLTNMTTSGIAVLCCQPVNVIKLHMQSGNIKSHRFRDIPAKIYQEEGLKGLWRGSVPIILRAISYTFIDTTCFNYLEERFQNDLKYGKFQSYFGASLFSAGGTIMVTNPLDVIRTRFVTAKRNEYKGILQCAQRTFLNEGLPAFYKGSFAAYYCTIIWDLSIYFIYENMQTLLTDIL